MFSTTTTTTTQKMYGDARPRMNYGCQINKDLGYLVVVVGRVVRLAKKNCVSLNNSRSKYLLRRFQPKPWPSLSFEKPKWRLVNGVNRSNVQHNESHWFITHCLINCCLYHTQAGRVYSMLARLLHRHSMHTSNRYYCVRLPSTIRLHTTCCRYCWCHDFFPRSLCQWKRNWTEQLFPFSHWMRRWIRRFHYTLFF